MSKLIHHVGCDTDLILLNLRNECDSFFCNRILEESNKNELTGLFYYSCELANKIIDRLILENKPF